MHLTLTCDLPAQPWGPLLPASQVPSLVDSEGHFWQTTAEVARHAKVDEAELELRAQIEQARASAVPISHLDHHMFVLYARPDLLELYARLGVQYDLPVRLTPQPMSPLAEANDVAWLHAYQSAVGRLRGAHLVMLDELESNNYVQPPEAKRAYHLDTIRRLRPGVTELVIHCAVPVVTAANPPNVERRAAETAFVISDEARNELRTNRIQLVSWRTLKRSASNSARGASH